MRKNIYTKEVIDYLLELITEKRKTIAEVIELYSIPKTTLYKWLRKRQAGYESDRAAKQALHANEKKA
ncbi:MAG: hypothetical protein EOO19_12710 [Chryseobacterium sp.]|nr:MAG: hypothetical protein EOO19_12710 [Chryseobacterium sp.]